MAKRTKKGKADNVKEAVTAAAETKEETGADVVTETKPEETVETPVEEAAVEEKPATSKSAPTPPHIPATPKPSKVAPSTRLKSMLKAYLELYGSGAVTQTRREQLVKRFSDIIQYAIRNTQGKTLQVMFDFFVKHQRTVLSEEVVFAANIKMGNTTRAQMEIFYAAMRAAIGNKTAKKKTKINLDELRRVLKNEDIVAFFSSK